MMNKIIAVALFLAISLTAFAQEAKLTIRVNAPATTPAQDSIIPIGNQGIWGFWIYPKSNALKSLGNNVWESTYSFPLNSDLEFKITRGSYFKEALYNGNGQSAQPIKLKITKDTTIVLNPSNWNDIYQRSIVGTVRYHHNFGSTYLKSIRNVVVWLPPSYLENTNKKYPVLYAHDGQNLFDHTNLSGSEWRMDEIADSLMRKGEIEEFIIVAMANTKDRWIEYNGTPEGENYLKFIVTELKPFIDKTYRTKTDRANTGIIGSSMGGLISFYAAYNYPQIFSKAACLSSGFFFDDGNIMNSIKTDLKPLHNSMVYLDCGGKDLDYDFLPSNQQVNELLQKDKQMKVLYKEFPEDPHNEVAWSKRLDIPFKFLFPKK
ncbi:alpha/beta hydrolase-fold protein [Sphingobacterium sp. WM]|uniref:alpha/beta hydrolase n=1 Tax=Sphingobacterium sp. WM TaxID=3031802 RepID=UPI00240E8FC9|nr:alpha/beta hydrolase-fold protein [Sphingobacterium sp. WM]WFB63134.1 alpha/beta hydrolase-fold protein [Sphingobacterium sp. WM]